MRKYLFLFLSLVCSITAFAGSDVKVKSGKATFVKENAIAILALDFSNTTWEKKENFKEFSGKEYEARLLAANNNFISSFNENSKGLKISKESNDAKYKIVFKVENLERHQSFTGMWGQGKISVTGTIVVTDIKSNETICTLYIDGFGNGKDFNTTDGIGKCFKGLAEEITKLKK